MSRTYTLTVTVPTESGSDDEGRIILSSLYLAQRSIEMFLDGRPHESSVTEARETA